MSKDQTRNIEIFKVGGARVDKFELSRQQGKTARQLQRRSFKTAGIRPLSKVEQVAKVTSAAHQKAERRKGNGPSSD